MRQILLFALGLGLSACVSNSNFESALPGTPAPASRTQVQLLGPHGYFTASRSSVTKVIVFLRGNLSAGISQDTTVEYDGEDAQTILAPLRLEAPIDLKGEPAAAITGNVAIYFGDGIEKELNLIGNDLEDPNYGDVIYRTTMDLDADWLKTANGH